MEEGETKKCTKCGEVKPLGEFGIDASTRTGKRSHCRQCRSTKNACDYRKDPTVVWGRWIKSRYGMELNDYYRMYATQNGCCAICGGNFKAAFVLSSVDTKSPVGKLCIEHNHATGEVRGLVCDDCNKLVGWMEKQRPHIARAWRYIRGELEVCATP